MLFDPFVVLAEGLVNSLLAGPGILPTTIAATFYTGMAAQLETAAVSVESSMNQMGESWRGPSSDNAQAAFLRHSGWLRNQGAVAAKTAAQLHLAAEAYTAAQGGMLEVEALLAAFEIQQGLLAAGGPSTFPALLLSESESLPILTLALGVMGEYQGSLGVAVEGFPEPVAAEPIVTGPGGTPTMTPVDYSPSGIPTMSTPGLSQSVAANSPSSAGSSTGQQTPTGPAQTTDPVTQTNPASPTGPGQPGSDLSPGTSPGDSGTNGSGAESPDSMNGQSVGVTSGSSPMVSGLGMGTGSLAAIGMTRGGLGSVSGSATGFRMPANWTARGGRAFGATDAEAEAEGQPVGRGAAPKGATAPEAQKRRRGKEKAKAGKVIAPGDEHEVPVLEESPVIGVLHYADEHEDYTAEPDTEPSRSIGVIERVDEESALRSVSGDNRWG